MDDDIHQALARTAQLLRMDVFDTPADDDRRIVTGLRATTARLVADRKNLTCFAGQTAFVTLYAQLAMMGLHIDLDIPDVELLCPQPPLNPSDLLTALVNYSDDLLPGGSSAPAAKADITFALGDTSTPNPDIRVSGTATHALVGPQDDARHVPWSGELPIGAIAAAAAAAAEGARSAIARIATVLDRPHPANPFWTRNPGRRIYLDLSRYTGVDAADLGEMDVISAGAITNAAVYTLLRMPRVHAALRVIDIDRLELGNLNRYALGRRSRLREFKTSVLASYATPKVRIDGQQQLLDDDTAESLRPFAPALLVGVDHIPSRWIAQREAMDRWVCVGATSHDYVLTSTHPAGQACAGCTHPKNDQTDGPIPTISFVSLWAGFIQALELLAHTHSEEPGQARGTHIWPLGLDGSRGLEAFTQAPAPLCPLGCTASRTTSNRSGD